MHQLLKSYEDAKKAIYDHCGFEEDWTVYPLDDRTDKVWYVDANEDTTVTYADTVEGLRDDRTTYEDEIYTQRFYKKWVFRGAELTLILVDTHCDGNKFFAIYSNDKEVKKPAERD
jgi:hypothetical protein